MFKITSWQDLNAVIKEMQLPSTLQPSLLTRGTLKKLFNKPGDGLDTVKFLTLFDLATHQLLAFARELGNLADISGIENARKNNIGQMVR